MGALYILFVSLLAVLVDSHAFLSNPPGRLASVYETTLSPATYVMTLYGTNGVYPFNSTTLQTCGADDPGRPADVEPHQFIGGQTITISWTMTQPHAGTPQEEIGVALTTTSPYNFSQYIIWNSSAYDVSGSDLYSVNNTVFSHQVTLPAITCNYCVLQWYWEVSSAQAGWIDCADVQLIDGCTGKICYALGECYNPGTCQSPFGNCTNPAKQDGTACSLGQCLQGVCTPPVTAPAASFNLTGILTRYVAFDSAPWCVANELCPSDVAIPQQTERLAWVLLNAARVGLDSFVSRYGFVQCGTSQTVSPPMWWDTGLQQDTRFHVDEMAQYDPCFQDNTCPANVYLFGGSDTWQSRVTFFASNTSQDGLIVTPREDYIGSAYPDALHMVMWWLHGGDLSSPAGPWWQCDGMMDSYSNSAAVGYKSDPVSRYGLFWNLAMGNANNKAGWNGRLWINALYGGGSHMIYNGNLRFIVNYYSKQNPQMVQVVVDGVAHDMAYHTGVKIPGILFGLATSVGSYYVDLPLPDATAPCSSYFFLARNADALFRFPEVGSYSTFNVSYCFEDYNSTTVEGEFVPVPGAPYMMNFTLFGYNPNYTINWGSYAYQLSQLYKKAYGENVWIFTVRTYVSPDNTTGWAIYFATEANTQWPIPAYLFTQAASDHAATRVELSVPYMGGLQADFQLTTAPYNGQDASAKLTTSNVIAASVLLSLTAVAFIALAVFFGAALLAVYAEKTKDWSLETHCYIIAGLAFVTWLLNVISQATSYWATTSGSPNAHIGLWTICVDNVCQNSKDVSNSGTETLTACRAFMVLAQFGGVIGFIGPLILSRKFLEKGKTELAYAVTIGLGVMFLFTYISVFLFLGFLMDVLRPQPTTNFVPNWSWALGVASMLSSLAAALYAYPLTNKSEQVVKAIETTKAAGEAGPKKVGDWEKLWDDNNKAWYFYNHKTNESTWDPPAGF